MREIYPFHLFVLRLKSKGELISHLSVHGGCFATPIPKTFQKDTVLSDNKSILSSTLLIGVTKSLESSEGFEIQHSSVFNQHG